jgi:hypothetical protein
MVEPEDVVKLATLISFIALCAALLLPSTASAGGIWQDGAFYAACPWYIFEVTEYSPSSGWETGWEGPGQSRLQRLFLDAYVSPNSPTSMVCRYGSGLPPFEITQHPPDGYTRCTAYNDMWFQCVK